MASQSKPEKIQSVRYAPPPPGVPMYGSGSHGSVCFLGRANYSTALQTKNFIFGIERNDRARHMYIIGKSGSGKSKFLELLVRQDIANGEGVCFIDPYGEIVSNLLDFIPENRRNNCIFLDYEDTEFPISINPFFGVPENIRHQYIEFLVQVFRGYMGDAWYPESEYVSRHIFQALLDYPNASFFGALLILVNREYREDVLRYIKDPVTRSFWADEFESKHKLFDEKVILQMKAKLGRIFFDPVARLLFAQTNHSVDFGDAMEKNKIILIRLPKGTVSDDIVSLVGSLCVASIRAAGIARRFRKVNSKLFYLYVDEFQNLQTDMFTHLFPEMTKAGISLTIAHRYMGQLSDSVRTSIFGNIGNLVVFRVSGEDAIRLRSEMAPVFEAKDMLNLGTREFYIKMTIRGEVYDPFSGEALKVLPSVTHSGFEEIRSTSRRLFAIPHADAEEMFRRDLSRYSEEKLEKSPKEE